LVREKVGEMLWVGEMVKVSVLVLEWESVGVELPRGVTALVKVKEGPAVGVDVFVWVGVGNSVLVRE
jgi:hypothetical protein